MKNRKSKNGRMTASGVAAASPFDALSFSEYSESSSVASACACLAERSDATCSRQAHAVISQGKIWGMKKVVLRLHMA